LRQEITSLTTNSELMPQVHLIWLESPLIASQAQPGQFVMVHCGEDTLLRRPFSIHRIDGKRLALLFNVVGIGTHWLSQCQPGDSLDLLGPLGNGFIIHPDSKNLLLVAGGIGIAPLVFLAQKVSKAGRSITLLLGAQTKSQLYPQNLLPPEVRLVTATEDGTGGKKGLVTDLLHEYINWADQVFACGPPSMYHTIAKQKLLKQKSVQISLEVRMGCGLGVCYGCTVKTKKGLRQVCQDGPIFELEEVTSYDSH
jgi:dihydroorotate dehydrogenase electron transfer subunit